MPTNVSKSILSECCLHTFKHSKRYNRAKTKACYLPGYGPLIYAKTQKNIQFILSTLTTIWRCACDFIKVLLKFNMAATDQLQFFCGHKNSNRNFHITFLATWGCVSVFLKMLRKFKMARQRSTSIFFVAKFFLLQVRNYSNFTIISPMIWRCAGDFF